MNLVADPNEQLRRGRIKCLVWDLDNTLWQGVLAEGDAVHVRPVVRELLAILDARGILQSIASKNDPQPALAKLEEMRLDHLFVHPQIDWGPKSEAIARIARAMNLGIDTFAFIDDQPFERDEVNHSHPEVWSLDPSRIEDLAAMPEFNPRFITDESAQRRMLYQRDAVRMHIENSFPGPKEEFLASLAMKFTITPAQAADLQRLEELTARTNQLNTTGRIFSSEQLDEFRRSDSHALLVASLHDRYGPYGKIGLALVEITPRVWTIRLLLMSCRVMSRGVGNTLLGHIMREAHAQGVALRADMVPNERNRLMYATYRFAGFQCVASEDGVETLQWDGENLPAAPAYIQVDGEAGRIGRRAQM